MADYQDFKTPSGKIVQVRQRSYEEWEETESLRVANAEKIIDLRKTDPAGASSAELRSLVDFRSRLINLWVKDWEKHKKTLTLGDVAAIEKHCMAMERDEIAEKN